MDAENNDMINLIMSLNTNLQLKSVSLLDGSSKKYSFYVIYLFD